MARKISVGIIALLLCAIITVPAFAQQANVFLEYDLSDLRSISEEIEGEDGNSLFLKEVVVSGKKCTALYSDAQPVQEYLPRIFVHYQKEVKKIYTSFSDIPQSIEYTEYNDGHKGWFSGTLKLTKTVLYGTDWHATFTGDLLGHI